MQKETYRKMTDGLRAKPTLARLVVDGNKAIANAIYVAYPCLLLWLLLHNGLSAALTGGFDVMLPKAFLVPCIGFFLLTLLRKGINAPRPYEVFDLPPVINKQTKGKSFPSRHTFSIFIIGVAFLACCPIPWAGWAILGLGVCLGTLRVFAGVHFPRDVVWAAIFAVAFGFIGFYIV